MGLGISFSYDQILNKVNVNKIYNYFNNKILPTFTYIYKDGELYRMKINSDKKVVKDIEFDEIKNIEATIFNLKNILPDFSFLQYSPIIYENEDHRIDDSFMMAMASIIKEFLVGFHYIGPLRDRPERYFTFSGLQTGYVGKSGKNVLDMLISIPEI